MPASIDTLAVFTRKNTESILRDGGSSAWKLDRYNARQCKYLVCVRNARKEPVEGPEAHGTAFLVGLISDVVPYPSREGRWIIRISDYAQINIPDAWKGIRNPVHYTSLDDFGLDPTQIQFNPMPETEAAPIHAQHRDEVLLSSRLTIDEAKRGLAATFGVKPEAIEIVIRG